MPADSSGRPALVADPAEIRRFVTALRQPGEVVELRSLKVGAGGGRKGGTFAGYYCVPDHLPQLEADAVRLSDGLGARGVYCTLNPTLPALLSRYHARLEPFAEHTTSDHEVSVRAWLPVDLDPVRPVGISASADEKAAALALVPKVKAFMADKGFAPPVVCDSGNGFHLLFPIALPAADGGKVEAVLKTLAGRFDSPAVKVDTSMYNPSRIVKLAGTVVRKGDDTPDRPHRLARVLEVPA